MKCLATSLVFILSCPAVCLAQSASDYTYAETTQSRPPFRLNAQNNTYNQPRPVGLRPQPSLDSSEAIQRTSRWRAIGRGLARFAQATAVVTATTAGQALRAYGEYSAYSAGYGSTYGGDSCAHGYTANTCPYGYYGNSYGSRYLSGDSGIRTRPDGYGNYRYYMSDGRSGRITRNYTGGYRLTSDNGDSIAASVSSLRSMGYQIPYDQGW